jgi:hypothetical protein
MLASRYHDSLSLANRVGAAECGTGGELTGCDAPHGSLNILQANLGGVEERNGRRDGGWVITERVEVTFRRSVSDWTICW